MEISFNPHQCNVAENISISVLIEHYISISKRCTRIAFSLILTGHSIDDNIIFQTDALKRIELICNLRILPINSVPNSNL